MVKLNITDTDGSVHAIDAKAGDSLMQAAVDAGLDVRAECGGSLACATCHMYIDPEWFDKLSEKSEDEADMLDFADQVKPTSRLSCQIDLDETLDGLCVTIAPGF
ncbi:MAG: 2Fe-2S iron-sulfur cluster-binding protein [Alphaproteobacteria bacterium]